MEKQSDSRTQRIKVRHVPLSDLKASEYNPRRISPSMLESLKNSIREFGVVDPIVVNARTNGKGKALIVVGGHQRLRAAREIGLRTVPVVEVSLDEKRERILNLALNKVAGDFDPIGLGKLLGELASMDVSLEATGFSQEEIAGLVSKMEKDLTPPEQFDDPAGEKEPDFQCPQCRYEWSGKPR